MQDLIKILFYISTLMHRNYLIFYKNLLSSFENNLTIKWTAATPVLKRKTNLQCNNTSLSNHKFQYRSLMPKRKNTMKQMILKFDWEKSKLNSKKKKLLPHQEELMLILPCDSFFIFLIHPTKNTRFSNFFSILNLPFIRKKKWNQEISKAVSVVK